jgi:hypothetical protein
MAVKSITVMRQTFFIIIDGLVFSMKNDWQPGRVPIPNCILPPASAMLSGQSKRQQLLPYQQEGQETTPSGSQQKTFPLFHR